MDTLNSGARARAWRRRLATSAKRADKTLRTLKFKLNLGDDRPFTFSQAVALYNITDGVGRGSLTGLLLAAHLHGFRLFMKAEETAAFRNRACFDDTGFRAAFLRESGLDLPDFVPSRIDLCLKTEVRATGGKDNRFVAGVIAHEYARRLTGKALAQQTDAAVAALFSGLGEALAGEFGSWRALQDETSRALACIDRHLAARGWRLPSLAAMAQGRQPLAPASSTLAFDRHARLPEGDISGFEPHVVVAMRLRDARAEGTRPEALKKRVQQQVTTDNNAGLSWLFGAGLRYLQTCSAGTAAQDFGVPPERRASLDALLDHARAIPADPLFAKTHYAAFRMALGGRLDGWIGNYLARLSQLENLLNAPAEPFVLPPALAGETGRRFFSGTGVDHDELADLLQRLDARRGAARTALMPLLGLGERLPVRADFVAVEDFSGLMDAVAGILAMVRNQIRQTLEEDPDPAVRTQAQSCLFQIPDGLAGLPAINRLRGGVPDFETEIRQALTDFATLRETLRTHLADIAAHAAARGRPLAPLACLARQEAAYLARFPQAGTRTEMNAGRRALCIVLHRFGHAARQCSRPVMERVKARYDAWGVFTRARDSNRFFLNRLGSLFRPVFSKSGHEAYAVDYERLAERDLLADLESLLGELEQAVFSVERPSQAEINEFLKLERVFAGLMLSGLEVDLPSELARPRLPEHLAEIPAVLRARLADAMVPADVAQRVFNLYQSVLSGLNVVANREHFFVRVRFQRVNDVQLVYVPKDETWAAPARLWQSAAPIRKVLEGPAIRYDSSDAPGAVKVRQTLQALCAGGLALDRATGEYLMQSPHHWAYRLDTRETVIQREGLSLGKGKLDRRLKSVANAFPLVGPSSFKNVLDHMLTEPDRFTNGDITLIVDNAYRQRVSFGVGGKPDVVIEDLGYTVSVAVPVEETAPDSHEDFPLADRCVAIDQGERGIAYAVFDVHDGELLDSGTVAIPSIRKLIWSAARYRKRGQPTQKFQQRFDSTLFVMRENVVGDICHAIINLMRKYKAFPVLEGTVRNLEGGSKQLELVYKTLSARFLYSDTEAHKTSRKSYWSGADQWVHPFLKQRERNEKGEFTRKLKPLNLFPGASGPTAGTSQACSRCGRNPLDEVRRLRESGEIEVRVGEGGQVNLPGGMIRLLAAPAPASGEGRDFRRRNLRAPLIHPIKSRKLTLADLGQVIRRNLRRPHPSVQSRDTSQSRYHCVYIDCGHTMHADINAAINIGRRFLQERLG